MRACRVKNPTIEVNGTPMTFPVEMQSGSYLELGGTGDAVLYDSKGAQVATVKPHGQISTLLADENQVRFSCETGDGPTPRVKLTVISHGDPL
jgi:hypothetical protein